MRMRKIYNVWLTYAFMDWRNKGSNIEITGLVNYLLLIQIQYLINSPVILKPRLRTSKLSGFLIKNDRLVTYCYSVSKLYL